MPPVSTRWRERVKIQHRDFRPADRTLGTTVNTHSASAGHELAARRRRVPSARVGLARSRGAPPPRPPDTDPRSWQHDRAVRAPCSTTRRSAVEATRTVLRQRPAPSSDHRLQQKTPPIPRLGRRRDLGQEPGSRPHLFGPCGESGVRRWRHTPFAIRPPRLPGDALRMAGTSEVPSKESTAAPRSAASGQGHEMRATIPQHPPGQPARSHPRLAMLGAGAPLPHGASRALRQGERQVGCTPMC